MSTPGSKVPLCTLPLGSVQSPVLGGLPPSRVSMSTGASRSQTVSDPGVITAPCCTSTTMLSVEVMAGWPSSVPCTVMMW